MDLDKRGRGRGRGSRGPRGRGRGGRGRGRGKKAAAVVSSDEDTSLDQTFDAMPNAPIEDGEVLISSGGANLSALDVAETVLYESNKETEFESKSMDDIDVKLSEAVISAEDQKVVATTVHTLPIPVSKPPPTVQQLDMEADISQLEAPTFTTISRGPPEPMLRLKWNHKVNLIGEKVLNPMIHCCDQCEKPILVYGRMIPCKHVFCLKCARAEPIKICPRCNDKVVRVEQSGLGTVFMCTHGGSRYGNTGCRRTYLSQRDLQAHINHRHVTQPLPSTIPTTTQVNNDVKNEGGAGEIHKSLVNTQRKVSESASNTTIQVPSTLLTQRPRTCSNIGTIPPPGQSVSSSASAQSTHSALTQANLARINNANAQDCHQGKVALHHTLKKTPITQSHNQLPETVADASYYSNVLNSFGSAGGVNNSNTSNNNVNPNSAAAVGYGFDSPSQPKIPSQSYQYYR